MSEPLRVGIVGLNRGLAHADAFSITSGATLAGFADIDPERRTEARRRFPEVPCHDDFDTLLAAGGLDAIVVATPTYLRERHTCAAFDAGLHALSEAPIGVSGRNASHIVTASGLTGKVFMWSSPLRFDPQLQALRGSIDTGTMGEPFKGSAFATNAISQEPGHTWRLDRDRGGGALLECGLEAMDALWFAMGCPEPTEAMAACFGLGAARAARGIEKVAEDSVAGIVRFKNGACMQFEADFSLNAEPSLRKIALRASQGAAAIEWRYADDPLLESTLLRAQADAFVQAARDGAEPTTTGKQALSLAKMLDAIAESGREKTAISIKVERTLDDLFGGL